MVKDQRLAMRQIPALIVAGLVSAGVHLLFEGLVSALLGPFSEVYPWLKDLTTETVWLYLSVFIGQGFLISLAYYLIEPAFANLGTLSRSFRFGLVLWILSAFLPILPLGFLYNIGYDSLYILNGIIVGFLLSEIMAIAFVFSYVALCRK